MRSIITNICIWMVDEIIPALLQELCWWLLHLGMFTRFKVSLLSFLVCYLVIFFFLTHHKEVHHWTREMLFVCSGKYPFCINIMTQSLIVWMHIIFSPLHWKDTGFIHHKGYTYRVRLRTRRISGILQLRSPSLSNLWSVLSA